MVVEDIIKWLKLSRDDTLDGFQSLVGSYTDGEDQNRFVYVQGSRPEGDRVLLVAHSDTVWFDKSIDPIHKDGVIYSNSRNIRIEVPSRTGGTKTEHGVGIGADDRAGCAIVWSLRHLGHSILITSGEEHGCIATKRLMKNKYWANELNKHNFAVQFDRRGCKDAVYYNVGTKKFVDYVTKETGYKPAYGGSTDIKEICKTITGVNLSTGYYDEHKSIERLSVSQFNNTLYIAKNWLSKSGLPSFALDLSDLFTLCYNSNHSNKTNVVNTNCRRVIPQSPDTNTGKHAEIKTYMYGGYQNIVCPHCNHSVTEEQWLDNVFICVYCKEEI